MSVPYGTAIFIKLGTTALSSLGVVIQRKSHVINDSKSQEEQKNALKRPLWHAGFWMYLVFSAVGSAFSITSLPILVIAPFSTFTLLFNAIYSHFLLQENMTWIGFIGTVLIAASSVGIAIILNIPEAKKNTRELVELLTRHGYLVYVSLTFVIFMVLLSIGIHLVRKHKKEQLIMAFNATRKRALSIAVLFELCATILASQAIIFAKISYDLLVLTLTTGENQFKDPVTPIILVCTAIFTIGQLVLFNVSLHYYTTVVIIPIGYSFGIALACLNTFVYYDSFHEITAWKTVLVVICVIITICGVYLLSKTSSTVVKEIDTDPETPVATEETILNLVAVK